MLARHVPPILCRGYSTAVDQVYDVGIVGAGMVGAAVAALLGACEHPHESKRSSPNT
jgi:hypothetical protein